MSLRTFRWMLAVAMVGSWTLSGYFAAAQADDPQGSPQEASETAEPAEATETAGETVTSGESEGDEEDEPIRFDTPYEPEPRTQLRRRLSRLQYEVTQEEATEPAFRNRYWNNKRKGVYECIVCGLPLFESQTKYKSGTGWPSFWAPVDPKNVGYKKDWLLFYSRIEVHCKRCQAHLGHVFDDGPPPTGKRFCMNSASLKFVPREEVDREDSSGDR